MSRGEKLTLAFIVVLFISMAYAVFSTAKASGEELPIPSAKPYAYPEIPQCELPLWDRIRYLCPREGDEE